LVKLAVFRVGKKAGNGIFIGLVKKNYFFAQGGCTIRHYWWIEERKKRAEFG
jgi:hypothetical protein